MNEVEKYLKAKGYSEKEAAQGAHEVERRTAHLLGKGNADGMVKRMSTEHWTDCLNDQQACS